MDQERKNQTRRSQTRKLPSPEDMCPDTVYIDRYLYLPKKRLPTIDGLKAALTLTSRQTMPGKPAMIVEAFRDYPYHLQVPREYTNQYPPGAQVVDCRKRQFDAVVFSSEVVPRSDTQEKAIEALAASTSGVLEMGCGKGKTVIATHMASIFQVPTMIVVNNTGHIDQWAACAEEFLGVRPTIVRGNKHDFSDYTIAMLHTLSNRPWPSEVLDRYGVVFFDECHHLSAPSFNRVCPMFQGRRFGLTATKHRQDGMENLYLYHLGEPVYTDLSTDLKPKVSFLRTGFRPTSEQVERILVNQRVNVSRLRTLLANVGYRNALILEEVEKARKKGRRILVLGHIVRHLLMLHNATKKSGIVTGSVPTFKRREELKEKDVIYATTAIAAEGLDAPWLDTLILISPFSARGLFLQAMGRVLRWYEGKEEPNVIILEDDTKTTIRMGATLRRILQEQEIDFKIDRETVDPSNTNYYQEIADDLGGLSWKKV